jgi:transposase
MTILPDLSDLVIEQVSITTDVTVTVRAASLAAPCPCCGTISKRVQSRYTRTLRDLPASGRLVHLIVHVRRFFCQQSTCVRKIFAERFPSLTLPRVKFTLRLQETLQEMGFALGGEAGARLGRLLSIPGSPDTLLRLVKRAELPPASSPRVVGLDDWSWKRRLRYGTLICDLESHKPIDVLPDRSVETVSAWFEKHPSIEIVSRDRSSEYAAAIKKGAPQALQVADRWHLGKNVAESVTTLLARCRAEIRRALQAQATPEQEREGLEVVREERCPPRSRSVELAREGRRAQKLDRYTQIVELHHQGLKAAEIASRVGIGERTVYRWLTHGSFPEARRRRRRPSLIDPYERYVRRLVARGQPEWVTALPRTDLSWLQGFIQSHVQLPGDLANPSVTLIQVVSSETAKAQEHPFVTCAAGKLLCAACHLAVCTSTRRAGRDATS